MNYYGTKNNLYAIMNLIRRMKRQYDKILRNVLTTNHEFQMFLIDITPKNISRYYSSSYLKDQIGVIYDQLQQDLFHTTNKSRTPQHLRPILILFQDIPGTRGDGKKAREILLGTENQKYQNLHFHGILLIHRSKLKNFHPKRYKRYLMFDIDIYEPDETFTKREELYGTKAVSATNLIDHDFAVAHVWHSYTRDTMCPRKLREHFNLPE